MLGTSYSDRFLHRIQAHPSLERLALRALMKANELLGLALGVRLAALRDSSGEPLQQAFAQGEVSAPQARLFQEIGDILAARWDKIPDRRRPHYTPAQRYRILRVKTLLALSQKETARCFRLSRDTVARWEEEARALTQQGGGASWFCPSLLSGAMPMSSVSSFTPWPLLVLGGSSGSLRRSPAPAGSYRNAPWVESLRRIHRKPQLESNL